MNTTSFETFKYMIRADGAEYYCKLTELIGGGNTIYTFSFGGKSHYCFNAAITSTKNFTPYIDNVEFNPACSKNNTFKGTTYLVKAALWTLKILFPHIERLTFLDDSHINCKKDTKEYKLSLAYDYILKNNKTWYEYHFNATLPGTDDNIETFLGMYKTSLKILDEPSINYEFVITKIPAISKYKETYLASNTPRIFINKLRGIYGSEYCLELSSWLSGYMRFLGIDLMKSHWFINAADITSPPDYELFTSTVELRGGRQRKRNGTRKRLAAPSLGYYGSPEFN